ncbi:MAG TPA: DUF4389 domain-containing protein [Patescibacteria group bacterium]
MEDKVPQNKRMYPTIAIEVNENPRKMYAIPVFGFILKIIMIVPVSIEIAVLGFADLFVLLINSFIVLFTGKYWKVSYDLNVALIRMAIKVNFFIFGLTDKYPGFGLAIKDNYSVNIPINQHPNRFYAIPILGGLVRIILLIPYLIYSSVLNYASYIAILVSWIPVLFGGYYPETTFEITRDANRIAQATSAYMAGLSDTYPSFWVSMNHKALKIILIILGILALLWNNIGKTQRKEKFSTQENMYKQYMQNITPTQKNSSINY